MGQGLSYALNRRFQELFDSAVDKALLLLGESGRQAAYYYLEETFGLKRDKWHSQVEEFAEAVEQIFGRFGAQLLLKAIAKELYSNIGIKFHDPKEFNFTRLVHEAKRNFLLGGGLLRRRKGVRKRRRGMRVKKPRILIVDDDESIRRVLTEILEGEGYVVDSARTAGEAIIKTGEKFYNLALIDIRLPDMDGVNLLTKIKETKPKMRKVIITGYPTLQNAVEALNKGADAYIMKPLDIDKMLATIRGQLEKQREEQEMTGKQLVQYIETRVKQLEKARKSRKAKAG